MSESNSVSASIASGTVSGAGAGGGRGRKSRRGLVIGVLVVGVLGLVSAPYVREALSTVSTDDAYVAGHATVVAARVGGQVSRVLVDDNNRVKKGDLLVVLDKEPFEVQVNISQAAVDAAEADSMAAHAQAWALTGQMRGYRFALDHAVEAVDNQIAELKSRAAVLDSARATLAKVQADYDRAVPLAKTGGLSAEDLDHRKQAVKEAEAQMEQALQMVYQSRVSLGLPAVPGAGKDLTSVPEDLNQTFSTIRQAQAQLLQAAAQLGLTDSVNKTPRQTVADFHKRDPDGNLDRIYAELVKSAPGVKQAEAKLAVAKRNLDQAKLNLRYCDVFAEVDGVVTRRDVNPGNNVIAGQGLMAVRSVTEIWVDANFKETQLGELKIGQAVKLDVDMYGGKHEFKGRISGFAMGTGSTLALLPAENATGNFVKVVQRVPVRVDLVDYDAEKAPLIVGSSVTAKVLIKEGLSGPDAGERLQANVASVEVASTRPVGVGPGLEGK